MHSESDRERGLTRRRLLELGAQGAVALGGAALLDRSQSSLLIATKNGGN